MRRALFSALYSIDKWLSTAHGRPPMTALHFCQPALPLEVEEELLLEQGTAAFSNRLDSSGWSLSESYGPASWIRVRFLISKFREQLQRMLLAAGRIVLRTISAEWQTLPKHMKYPNAALETCTDRQRLMLASVYLDYPFIEFQAKREIHRYTDTA
ncbi:hypothetical protein BBP40_010983 [Aspergillus hancockii]|nr:hypothetical protein BBP40_010983 [Aspergillus hancockii]